MNMRFMSSTLIKTLSDRFCLKSTISGVYTSNDDHHRVQTLIATIQTFPEEVGEDLILQRGNRG